MSLDQQFRVQAVKQTADARKFGSCRLFNILFRVSSVTMMLVIVSQHRRLHHRLHHRHGVLYRSNPPVIPRKLSPLSWTHTRHHRNFGHLPLNNPTCSAKHRSPELVSTLMGLGKHTATSYEYNIPHSSRRPQGEVKDARSAEQPTFRTPLPRASPYQSSRALDTPKRERLSTSVGE